jgi:hypothetical protein
MIYCDHVKRGIAAVLLVVAMSGCSMVYRKGRPNVGVPPTHYVACTNVYGPIVIDGVLATLLTIPAVALARQNANDTNAMAGDSVPMFIFPAMFVASGIYGIVHVNDCSEHHEAWARAHPESPNGPLPPIVFPYRPPPPGSLPPPGMQFAPGTQIPVPMQPQQPPPQPAAPQPPAPQPPAPQPPAQQPPAQQPPAQQPPTQQPPPA